MSTLLCLGFGFTARACAARLTQTGWRVVATTRSHDSAAAIEALGHQPLVADPADPDGADALRLAVAEADAVLSSAPPGQDGDPFLPVVEGAAAGRWLGYLSTTGVYGDRQGGWAFESDALTPGQARSVRRAEAEAGWSALGARVFRLAGIYGPGRSAFDRLKAGGPVFDKPGHVFSRIHVEDIASAVAAALERPSAVGAFNLADDWPDTQRAVMEGAAQISGLPAPDVRSFDPEQATPMQASFYAECRRVSNARAKAVLGWRPAYPSWREGLGAIWRAGG